MAYGDRTTCKFCGREIIQVGGGHRQRVYCDDNCRQRAHKQRHDMTVQDTTARCAICGCGDYAPQERGARRGKQKFSKLVYDHDHTTGIIRGILCHRCNTALGWFNDDPGMLQRARFYLEQATTGRTYPNMRTSAALLGAREKFQLELLAIGELLHWRRLINGQTMIMAGEESWRAYVEQEETSLLESAIRAARFYYDNLKSLGMLS